MSSSTVNLNVFSNVASGNPRDCLVPEAIKSFYSCFGESIGPSNITTRIFIDPKPYRQNFNAWLGAITDGLLGYKFEIIVTEGLVDGYWRSVRMSEGSFAMQLEHDFVFLTDRICHSWAQLTGEMQRSHITFIRFNKRRNLQLGYDLFMERDCFAHVPLSRVNGRSNNPHIIDVRAYKQLLKEMPFIISDLEGGLCRRAGGGHIYGDPGSPRTVLHLDGRGIRFKDGAMRLFWKLKSYVKMVIGRTIS